VTSVKKQMAELQIVNQTLESNITAARSDFSNKIALADANLRTTEADLEKTIAEAKAETKALSDSNNAALALISELETRNESLDKESAALHLAITNLDAKIAVTQEKLAKSEGDREFLLKQLTMMQAEKLELENKFNNIADVKLQLHKLKVEAAISRRLDSMRKTMYDSFKGPGELSTATNQETSSDATVELKQHGGVKIQTNSPSGTPPK
jgi:chromosome segregation ATPase